MGAEWTSTDSGATAFKGKGWPMGRSAGVQWVRFTGQREGYKKKGLVLLSALGLHLLIATSVFLLKEKNDPLVQTSAERNPVHVHFDDQQTASRKNNKVTRSQPAETADSKKATTPKSDTALSRPLLAPHPSPLLLPKSFATQHDRAPTSSVPGPSLRDLLPNSNRSYALLQQALGRKAEENIVGEGTGDGSSPIDFNTREYKYSSYIDGAIRQIENVWVYPEAAARSGLEGQAVYLVMIGRDGSLKRLVQESSTGYPILDRAIESAVRDASPFNPVPERIDRDPLVLRIRFTYTLTRFGIF